MKSNKNNRRSLFYSVISLLLCISMLLGTTLAWFSDSVSSTGNIIKTGRLKVAMHYADDLSGEWKDASEATIFNGNYWEPGYSDMKYIKVSNTGNLAFSYQMHILPAVQAAAGDVNLADVIDVYLGVVGSDFVAPTAFSTDMPGLSKLGTLAEVMAAEPMTGILLPEKGTSGALPEGVTADTGDVTYCVVLHMQETAGNEYQNLTVGNNFTIQLVATQYGYEQDNFGGSYDAGSEYPDLKFPEMLDMDMGSAEVTLDAENKLTKAVTLKGTAISANVPAGVLVKEGTTKLTLTVEEMDDTTSNITLGEGEEMRSLNVHVSGVSEENTVPMIISLGEVAPEYLNQGNLNLAHVENGVTVPMTRVNGLAELDAHNEYYYDVLTGELTVAMATFSEVALVADMGNAWNGEFDYEWYDDSKTNLTIVNADQLAGFSAIVGGMNEQTQDSFSSKTVKLLSDINLNDTEEDGKIFYPIGYYNSTGSYQKESGGSVTSDLNSFEGTFDGNGHTISNFYQNTWEMFGDYNSGYSGTPNHYDDGMGLFGYVVNGKVCNLTVDNFSSDGEFTPTGVIAAYAVNSTFENIAITNCNPRVYNTGNGGIVGIGGNSDDSDAYKLTFTNITIDNTNQITALWGSWDVACGGLVGMFRGAGHVYMTNCHVAAQMDVYNDVCGNYQYYWYRYSGMLVGTNNNMTTNDKGNTVPETTKFHAENCTVHFGEWNDYYYCELVANSLASYTHDHQFSRLEQISSLDKIKSGDNWTKAGNFLLISGDTKTCYHIIEKDGTLKQHLHTDAGEETVNGETVLKEDKQIVYLPFNQLFTGYGWGVEHIPLGEFGGVTILDREVAKSVVKFESKFTGDFLYRVGTQNEVNVGTLFAAKDGANINNSGVYVTITSQHNDEDIMGSFTAPTSDANKDGVTDWRDGQLKFYQTGVVKVTIQDYEYCTPTELYLEVVDAVNATTATNATSNNVVLLNDISGTFKVSNGHTFYGNGFKVTCSGNGSYSSKALAFGFITVENGGMLDHVEIQCDIFPASYLYTTEMTADSNGKYPYAYSAVAVTGNSTISNCYIYGARNNIYVGTGNVTIENTVTECGSLSNIQIKSSDANTVTLSNVTTIQHQTTSKYDTSKKVLGFGVVVGDNESASNPTLKLTGELTQYNWVTDADKTVSNTYAKTAITEALKVEEYQHTINDKTSVNMGIAYLNAQTATIVDERTNKNNVPYKLEKITMSGQTGQVYSVSNAESPKTDYEGAGLPNINATVVPTVEYANSEEAAVFNYAFNTAQERWEATLQVDLDRATGGTYKFAFNELKVKKHGAELKFTVTDASGNRVNENAEITLNQLATYEYKLEIEDTMIFDKDGKQLSPQVCYCPFVLSATKTSIEPPKFTNAGTATAIRLVSSAGGDWRPAYTALTGVSVTYWSASESKVKTVDLSTLYNSGTISSNVWTYTCDDYTLTITGGAVHSDGTVITPVVANNTLYFASTNKAFGTGTTSRNIILTYVFTDKNASTTWNRTETVTYSELSEYDYNSFKNNGTLTEPSSGGGTCLAEGTLITLADGSKKAVEDLRKGDSVIAFDHVTGKIVSSDVIIVVKTNSGFYLNTFVFDDGTELVTINEHGVYDLNLNRYVNISHENGAGFIGHEFVSVDSDGNLGVKKLIDVVSEYSTGYKYDIVTNQTLNYVAEDTLSVTHVLVDIINTFDFTEEMVYDQEKMQADMEQYGLYTYDEWEEYCDISVYEQYNIPVMKVGVSKGMYTKDYIVSLINTYVLDDSVQIVD